MAKDPIIYRRVADLPHGEIDGELVALDMHRGECLGLDAIGTEIWKLLDTPRTLDQIVAILVAEYDVSDDACRADVGPFLSAMADAGLVAVER